MENTPTAADIEGDEVLPTVAELIGNHLDGFLIYVTGSTPLSVKFKVTSTLNDLPNESVDAFLHSCILAAATHRRQVEEYLAKPANIGASKYITKHFFIDSTRRINISALNLLGHCFLAGGITNLVSETLIRSFRRKLGGNSIWQVNLNRSKLSREQKEILREKVLKFNLDDARESGKAVLLAICEKTNVPSAQPSVTPTVSFAPTPGVKVEIDRPDQEIVQGDRTVDVKVEIDRPGQEIVQGDRTDVIVKVEVDIPDIPPVDPKRRRKETLYQ